MATAYLANIHLSSPEPHLGGALWHPLLAALGAALGGYQRVPQHQTSLVQGGDPVSQSCWGTQSWGGVALDPVWGPGAMGGADYREWVAPAGAERLCPLLVKYRPGPRPPKLRLIPGWHPEPSVSCRIWPKGAGLSHVL